MHIDLTSPGARAGRLPWNVLEREKMTKYDAAVRQLCDTTGAAPLFVPFVLESLGLLHDTSHNWLQNTFSGHPDVRTALYRELSGLSGSSGCILARAAARCRWTVA